MRQSPNTLRDVEIFRCLTAPARAEVERRCSFRNYRRGGTIIHARDATHNVFFLIAGRARVILHAAAGKPVSFREIGVGEMFGEFAAIDGKPRSTAVEALEATRVAAMPGPEFIALLSEQPLLMRAVLVHEIAQLRTLTERVFEYSTLAVDARIHAEIVRLARAGVVVGRQARISPFPKHAEIASRISTHREAVARRLSVLAKNKLIERRGGTLVVHDLLRLERMLAGARGD
jgi:CRP/FNR family transcriptional regulator, cyclic AMP receptor protein